MAKSKLLMKNLSTLFKQVARIAGPYQQLQKAGIEPQPSRLEKRAMRRLQDKIVALNTRMGISFEEPKAEELVPAVVAPVVDQVEMVETVVD